MRKDNVRDYATAAFREYARLGCPSPEEIQKERNAALAADLRAVGECLQLLCAEDKAYIADAVRAVYFVAPGMSIKKGEIGARVAAFARACPASEREVYRWLKQARVRFAAVRGLRVRK